MYACNNQTWLKLNNIFYFYKIGSRENIYNYISSSPFSSVSSQFTIGLSKKYTMRFEDISYKDGQREIQDIN